MTDFPCLTFTTLAWLKLQFLCHAGPTEVGGFGISADEDLLRLTDIRVVRQTASPVSVRFHDDAVANHFDASVDQGLQPERFARTWIHTHPGNCPYPSAKDEETFRRSFGGCNWAVMFILSRAGASYARLTSNTGFRLSTPLTVRVDWSDWLDLIADLPQRCLAWREEYLSLVEPETVAVSAHPRNGRRYSLDDFDASWYEPYLETWEELHDVWDDDYALSQS